MLVGGLIVYMRLSPVLRSAGDIPPDAENPHEVAETTMPNA